MALKTALRVFFAWGGITQEEIESIIGKVEAHTHSSSNPKAPGQLQSHYAPRKKLILGNLEDLIKEYSAKTVGILSFQKDFQSVSQFILSPNGQLDEAAKNLFAALRALDKLPGEIILAELVPDVGLGRAINDRLRRAAGSR